MMVLFFPVLLFRPFSSLSLVQQFAGLGKTLTNHQVALQTCTLHTLFLPAQKSLGKGSPSIITGPAERTTNGKRPPGKNSQLTPPAPLSPLCPRYHQIYTSLSISIDRIPRRHSSERLSRTREYPPWHPGLIPSVPTTFRPRQIRSPPHPRQPHQPRRRSSRRRSSALPRRSLSSRH